MSSLFEPITAGSTRLLHRVVMAPLTRVRASDAHVHGPLATEYYTQRASTPGTLLITEATFIAPRAGGMSHVPGIWNEAQIAAWKNVTDSVHKNGSSIFLQLWALGRAAGAEVLAKEGIKEGVVSSSDIPIDSDHATPRPLSEQEIWDYVRDYAQAARNAIAAGFDGVEVHGANGYLIDQFTQDRSNNRTDAWGGSVEKRARFALEVTKAVVEAVGAERVGIRLSPWSLFQSMRMKDPVPQFSYLIGHLKELGLAYLHLVQSNVSAGADVEADEQLDWAFDIWGKTSPVLLAGGYTGETAKSTIGDHPQVDKMIVFGRHFIANPDLPFRIQNDLPLNKYDRSTFYIPEEPHGYVDYPFSKEWYKQSRL